MKTLIIYSTKYGSVEKSVDLLKKGLKGEVEVCNLKKSKVKDLSDYDNVIVGSPVYIGNIRKEVKKFITDYQNDLLKKKLGLFVCCLKKDQEALDQLNLVFPKELVEHATAKEYFGGEIKYKKMGFFDRLITKAVSKADDGKFPTLDENKNGYFMIEDHIDQFIKKMNQ